MGMPNPIAVDLAGKTSQLSFEDHHLENVLMENLSQQSFQGCQI
jgi:hypothetical protein